MRKPNLFLRATLATSLVTLASSAVNGQFANGLVAHWAFDDNLDDSTATGAHGTFVPGLDNDPASYVAAKFGNGIDLNNFDRGVFDEHIDIASVPEDTFDFAGGSMTVSAWVSSSFAAENQAIVTKGEGNSWRLISSGQNASVAMHGGGLTAADDPIVDLFSDFQFHHLVGVVEAGVGVKIYVDGQLVGNTPGNPVIGNSTFNLTIGENPEAGFFRFWEGAIDDMAIWSRPLSGSEVATIYNNGTGVAIAEILNPVDSDNDGMPDFYENSNGLNPNLDDADDDLDGDGRSNIQEFQEGTNPDNTDTDGDFLTDGEEFTLGTSPTTPDTDGDKITDFEEVNGTINPFLGGVLRDPFDPLGDPAGDPTNPLDADTDDDTFDDLTEIEFKADPNDATDRPSRWQIGLKGYWKLNIDDWTNSDPDPLLRTFEDSSGRGFHGVLAGTNTTSLNNFAGPFGSSVVRFDGTDQRIVISGDPAEFDFPNGEMTVSAWFLIPGWTKNWQAIVAKGEGNNWRLHRNGASPNLAYTGGTPDLTGGPAVSTLRWHHVAATTANGMDKSLYYDGELVGTATGAALGANGNAMMISGNPDAAGEGHRSIFGAMTEVAVWCRALSGTEIRTIWNGYDGASGGATIEDLIIGLDTDGDGMSDIFELANGLDPNDATGDNGADGDLDMDGRTNLQEHDAGTPPDDADPDGDGLNDGDEFAAGTDPLDADTDNDEINDGDEIAANTDPLDPLDPPPPPLGDTLVGHWTFEPGEELIDLTGNFPNLALQGNAQIVDGKLDVNGTGTSATGWAYTPGSYTGPQISDKTLISWATLQSLENIVKAGSVLTIDKVGSDQFDGIIFAERQSNRWMNGSNNFSRTQDFGPGFAETTTGEEIMLAITYENTGGNAVRITGYRNGVQIGQYDDDPIGIWPTGDTEVIFGKRHGNPATSGPGGLDALISEARIYRQAATASQLINLYNARLAPQGRVRITDVQRDDPTGDVTIEWESVIGSTYTLEWSPDLTDASWNEDATAHPAGGATSDRTSYTFTGIPLGTIERFFRVAEE